jgi:DNA-directed RNA polymerase specialized sigma24 family protein
MSRTCYQVTVSREDGDWVGAVNGVPGAVVETRRLDHLEDEIRDGLALLLSIPWDSFDLDWSYELPPEISTAVEEYRRASARLADAEAEYAEVSRKAVAELRRAHVSQRNAAALLGVSHQRVHQLAADARRKLIDA